MSKNQAQDVQSVATSITDGVISTIAEDTTISDQMQEKIRLAFTPFLNEMNSEYLTKNKSKIISYVCNKLSENQGYDYGFFNPIVAWFSPSGFNISDEALKKLVENDLKPHYQEQSKKYELQVMIEPYIRVSDSMLKAKIQQFLNVTDIQPSMIDSSLLQKINTSIKRSGHIQLVTDEDLLMLRKLNPSKFDAIIRGKKFTQEVAQIQEQLKPPVNEDLKFGLELTKSTSVSRVEQTEQKKPRKSANVPKPKIPSIEQILPQQTQEATKPEKPLSIEELRSQIIEDAIKKVSEEHGTITDRGTKVKDYYKHKIIDQLQPALLNLDENTLRVKQKDITDYITKQLSENRSTGSKLGLRSNYHIATKSLEAIAENIVISYMSHEAMTEKIRKFTNLLPVQENSELFYKINQTLRGIKDNVDIKNNTAKLREQIADLKALNPLEFRRIFVEKSLEIKQDVKGAKTALTHAERLSSEKKISSQQER